MRGGRADAGYADELYEQAAFRLGRKPKQRMGVLPNDQVGIDGRFFQVLERRLCAQRNVYLIADALHVHDDQGGAFECKFSF